MKMGKLFSSIATATMVLTTLAPAAVANAATGHATNVAGSGVAQEVSNGDLPMATSSKANDSAGSATAQSDANVKVIDGFLVLNSVPDLGFGVAIAGNTVKLHDGNSMRRDDGNDQRTLEVVDSRKTDSANGFTVTASLGQFANTQNVNFDKSKGDFVLTLNDVGVAQNKEFGAESTNKGLSLTAGGTNNSGTVLQAAKGSRGTHTFVYRNTTTDATLKVPEGAAADEYSASITWSLAPTAA